MKRDFLTELGIDTDKIDSIMKEHGKTVNALKDDLDKVEGYKNQITDLKGQIKDRDQQLEKLSETAKGSEDLTKEIERLKEENKTTQKEYESKLQEQAKEFAIDKALSDAKAKNPKAVKALLDLENVKLDGESLLGLKEQVESLQESDSYLFGEEEPPGLKGRTPNPSGQKPEPNQGNPWKTGEVNLSQQYEIMKENPERAKKLIQDAGKNPSMYGL